MTQREQIETLQADVAELRKTLTSLTEAILQLAMKQPAQTPHTPHTPYAPPTNPYAPWYPTPVWVASGGSQSALQGDGVAWNNASCGDITGD